MYKYFFLKTAFPWYFGNKELLSHGNNFIMSIVVSMDYCLIAGKLIELGS